MGICIGMGTQTNNSIYYLFPTNIKYSLLSIPYWLFLIAAIPLWKHCIPGGKLADEGRLLRLLEAGASHHGDPVEYLQSLGVALSRSTPKNNVFQ